LSIYKRNSGGFFYLRFTEVDGTTRKSSLKTKDRKEANGIAAEIISNVNRGKFGIPPKNNTEDISLGVAVERFKAVLNTTKSPPTAVRDGTSISNFLHIVGSNIPIKKITRDGVERYLESRKKKRICPKTINEELRVIKTFLEACLDKGYIEKNPATKIKRAFYIPPESKFFQKEQLKKILVKSESPYKEIFSILANTGLRIGELINLEFTDVFLKDGLLKVRNKANWQVKNRKGREIPLNGEAFTALIKLKEKSFDGNVISGDHYRRRIHLLEQLKGILKKLGMETTGYGLHTFRHTFASHLVMAKVDLMTVCKLLGHSNITITMKYSHLVPEHLSKAVYQLEEYFKRGDRSSPKKILSFS